MDILILSGCGMTLLCCCLCGSTNCSKKEGAQQQQDIYNISSQVQNQEQWPTHDAHVSIEHINIMNQLNKPMYDDAPPSYDEVMKTAAQNAGEASSAAPPQVIVVAPTSRTH